jgi:RND family efflux transporter MFP subunit
MRTLQIGGALAASVLAAACANVQGVETTPARPVKVQTVAAAVPESGIRYSASIEPDEQVQLAFKTTGYVDELSKRSGADGRPRSVQAGDFIGGGTVLARVREADYRQRVDQSRASLAQGNASLMKARLDLDRARALFAADSLTKSDLDAAQANFDASEAKVAAARADVELAMNALGDCALVSPLAGVILERRIELGSLVGAGTIGFLMGDVSSVKARFGIPDSIIQSLNPGDGLGVTVESVAGTTFSGRVTSIAPAADPQSRVFSVEVTIPNRDGRLRPGMIGSVTVGQRPEQAATQPLTLPLGAILRSPADRQQYAVFVAEHHGDEEVARLRMVALGDVVGNGVAVVSGVAAGDRVITTGATILHDGDRVRIIP